MNIIEIDTLLKKGDFDVYLYVKYKNFYTFNFPLKIELFDFLVKKYNIKLIKETNFYKLEPVLEIGLENINDINKIEKSLFSKYFNYNVKFEDYFDYICESLSQYKTPNLSFYLREDILLFNRKIYENIDLCINKLQNKNLLLKVSDNIYDFKIRMPRPNHYCYLCNKKLHIGPYEDGIFFEN